MITDQEFDLLHDVFSLLGRMSGHQHGFDTMRLFNDVGVMIRRLAAEARAEAEEVQSVTPEQQEMVEHLRRVVPVSSGGTMYFSTVNNPTVWETPDPPKQTPLDEKTINECYRKSNSWMEFVRLVEAKHGIGETK